MHSLQYQYHRTFGKTIKPYKKLEIQSTYIEEWVGDKRTA